MSLDSLELLQEGIRDLSFNEEMTKVLDMVMDTFYEPLADDIPNFYNPDLCLDYSELTAIFDPYHLSDILSDDEAQSRKYFKIIKTLYSLKGTLQGLRLVLHFLKVQYAEIIQSRLGDYAADITLFLNDDSPDLRQFRRIDQLTNIFLPINVRMEGVTNWSIFGGVNNWNLGPAVLDYGCVFGMNKLDRPYGNLEPTVSKMIYFYLLRDRYADMVTQGDDFGQFDTMLSDYITADLDCTLYQYVKLDRNLILGMQDVTNLYAYSTGHSELHTEYLYNVATEDELRLLALYPDQSWEGLDEYKNRYFDDYRQAWCFGALILDWHATLGGDDDPMDGNRGQHYKFDMLSANFRLGESKLDRWQDYWDTRCGITRRVSSADCAADAQLDVLYDYRATGDTSARVDLSGSLSWRLDYNLFLGRCLDPRDDGYVQEDYRTHYQKLDVDTVTTIQGQGYDPAGYDPNGYDDAINGVEIADVEGERWWPVATTSDQWSVAATGTGSATFDATAGITLSPQAEGSTGTAYGVSVSPTIVNTTPQQNLTLTATATTVTPLAATPAAGDNLYLLFNTVTDTSNNVTANYAVLRTDGIELGTAAIAAGGVLTPTRLAFAAAPAGVAGTAYNWIVTKSATTVTVWLGGVQALTYTGAFHDVVGSVAFYALNVNAVVVNPAVRYA